MKRTIFHVDVNSAFLSWTAVKRLKEDPEALDLRQVPSIIGGREGSTKGIVSAKSIPAKKYGIVTGEPVISAMKKCPNLIIAEIDFQTYREYSHAMMEIFHEYTPLVQQASIDEAYLDFTGMEQIYQDLETEEWKFPLSIAYALKDRIYRELGFTVNIGVSENKLLAKMASDFQKPNKVHTLYLDEVPTKMWKLPIGDLFGCGKRSAEKLRSVGILTIGDAANTDLSVLQSFLGEKAGAYIYRSANGISDSPVKSGRDAAKSYSNETTFSPDITAEDFERRAPEIVRWLSESVGRRIRRDQIYVNTIDVSVKTNAFKRRSRQKKLSDATDCTAVIEEEAMKMLRELCMGQHGVLSDGTGIRLIGVGGSGIEDGSYRQMNLFDLMDTSESKSSSKSSSKLDQMVDDLEKKFGRGIVQKGGDL